MLVATYQMCNKNIQKRDKKKTQLLCRRCNQDPNMDDTQFWTTWFNITNTIYQHVNEMNQNLANRIQTYIIINNSNTNKQKE